MMHVHLSGIKRPKAWMVVQLEGCIYALERKNVILLLNASY